MEKISKEHLGNIIKYIGISFITGGISHGFFSGTRSIITSIIGVFLFLVGNLMLSKNEGIQSIIYYCGLAIGIGCLTGGLQHFPDSPDRSLIITPLGFFASCVFFILSENKQFGKIYWRYAIIGTIVVTLLSILAYIGFEKGYIPKGEIHGHAEEQNHIKDDTMIPGTNIQENNSQVPKIPGDPNDGHTEHSH